MLTGVKRHHLQHCRCHYYQKLQLPNQIIYLFLQILFNLSHPLLQILFFFQYPLLLEGDETNKIESAEGDETNKIESGEEVIESDLEVAVCDSSDTDNVEDKEPASE